MAGTYSCEGWKTPITPTPGTFIKLSVLAPQRFTEKQGSAWGVATSDNKWQQDLGPEHLGKIRSEKQRGSHLSTEVIIFF